MTIGTCSKMRYVRSDDRVLKPTPDWSRAGGSPQGRAAESGFLK